MATYNNWEEIKELIASEIVENKSIDLEKTIFSFQNEWERRLSFRVAPGNGSFVRDISMFVPLQIYANTVFKTGNRIEYKSRYVVLNVYFSRRGSIRDLSKNEGNKLWIKHTIIHHYENENVQVPFLPTIWEPRKFGNLQGEYNEEENKGSKIFVIPKSKVYLKQNLLKRKANRMQIRKDLEELEKSLLSAPEETKEQLEGKKFFLRMQLSLAGGGKRRRSFPESTVSFRYCVETQQLRLYLDYVEKTHEGDEVWS